LYHICSIADQKTPRDRMVQVVRWYLSAFHAGRKSGVAKKPYNPILGEMFRCYYELPDDGSDQVLELAAMSQVYVKILSCIENVVNIFIY